MQPAPGYRDIEASTDGSDEWTSGAAARGRMYVVVIGIDRYRTWSPLHNAVQDARGALEAFLALGFLPFCEPLLNEAATFDALRLLVTDRLKGLGQHDSLVLFFAGHGHTLAPAFSGDRAVRRGFLIPADAEVVGGGHAHWLELDAWLREIAHLAAKHILVILDACHSGIALDPATRWRGESVRPGEPLHQLRARRSRRVITSALGDELAMDGGPIAGHSLFTGCLIEALTGGVFARFGRRAATGSEIWTHVRDRVFSYSDRKRARQTPEFGRLDFDDHGELVVELPAPAAPSSPPAPAVAAVTVVAAAPPRPPRPAVATVAAIPPSPPAPGAPPPASADAGSDGGAVDLAFVQALDRHAAERRRGAHVLSVLAGEPLTTLTGWASWAGRRGVLTLVTRRASLDPVLADLLAQAPWFRSLRAARGRLAAAAGLSAGEVGAALDARSAHERTIWIDDITGMDPHARVAAWLLSALRERRRGLPDLATAPVHGGELLAILCDLATPIGVLMHHAEPTAAWLERAIPTAATLAARLPQHAVAIAAPGALVDRVLGERESAATSLARQGVVPIAEPARGHAARASGPAARILHDALARDPRTAGRFARNAPVRVAGGATLEVDLVAAAARLAIEIDSWFHVHDQQGYGRRHKNYVSLQDAGFFVMRLLSEDIAHRLAQIVDEIATGLGGSSAAGSQVGEP